MHNPSTGSVWRTRTLVCGFVLFIVIFQAFFLFYIVSHYLQSMAPEIKQAQRRFDAEAHALAHSKVVDDAVEAIHNYEHAIERGFDKADKKIDKFAKSMRDREDLRLESRSAGHFNLLGVNTRGHYLLRTKFPNVHTAPLNRTTRSNFPRALLNSENADDIKKKTFPLPNFDEEMASLPFPSLAPEAQALLDQYSDVDVLSSGDKYLDEVLVNDKRKIRPEAALLLKKVQALNHRMRKAQQRKRRVVIVHPVGQLCNRLMSIASGFMLALLSKRALYVDDTDFYCKSQDLFLDPGFDWTSPGASRLDSGENAMFGGGGGGSNNVVILENPETGPWSMAEPLLCSNYTSSSASSSSSSSSSSIFGKAETIVLRTNQYIVPYLQRNTFYRRALESLFPASHGGVFHAISHFLFRPLPALLKERDEFMRTAFDPGYFIVGLQVRAGQDFTDHGMRDSDWKLYADCALASAPKEMRDKGKVRFFVATDTAAGRQKAAQVLGRDKVIFGPGEFQLSNNPRGVQLALLDLLLLEQCDDRVATAWSTFGYFAAGRSGLPSNLVCDKASDVDDEAALLAKPGEIQRYMGVKHKSDKRRQCVRLPTQQPCFMHFENWGASKVTCARRVKKQWLKEEMLGGRYC